MDWSRLSLRESSVLFRNLGGAIGDFVSYERLRLMFRRIIVAILVRLIRFYQIGISPLIGPSCRFTPTCSQYAIEVIRKDGPLRGCWRTVRRIAKCHPFHPGGYDPP